MKFNLIWIYLLIVVVSISYLFIEKINSSQIEVSYKESSCDPIVPVSLKIYFLIEKYSEEYNIPKYVAYNIDYKETTYRGPFDWSYNAELVSVSGAVGPMQIIPSTASYINKEKINKDTLLTDLDLNVMTSMKYLRYLKNRYKSWDVVCGFYNTGKPVVNKYATYCSSNEDYKLKWIRY
jgi:soluble lytic murein transglycosylase-like protein